MRVFLGGDSYSPIKMESDTYGNPRWVGIKSVPWRDLIEHSVRCMHAVIGKFTNLHFGILNKSEILGLKGLKVCP